jgi:hypothetical protein
MGYNFRRVLSSRILFPKCAIFWDIIPQQYYFLDMIPEEYYLLRYNSRIILYFGIELTKKYYLLGSNSQKIVFFIVPQIRQNNSRPCMYSRLCRSAHCHSLHPTSFVTQKPRIFCIDEESRRRHGRNMCRKWAIIELGTKRINSLNHRGNGRSQQVANLHVVKINNTSCVKSTRECYDLST